MACQSQYSLQLAEENHSVEGPELLPAVSSPYKPYLYGYAYLFGFVLKLPFWAPQERSGFCIKYCLIKGNFFCSLGIDVNVKL